MLRRAGLSVAFILCAFLLPAAASAQTTPPPMPTGLKVWSETTSAATFVWNTVPGATDYRYAYRIANGCTSGCTYTLVDQGSQTAGVLQLQNGATAFVYVEACNGAGCSDWAGELTLTTVPLTPAAPTPTAGPSTATSVTVNWLSSFGAGRYVVGYRVANGCTSGCTYTTVDVPGSPTSYTITGLTSPSTVYAYVAACGVHCSAWSTTAATLQTSGATTPQAPTNVRAGTATASSVQVLWDASSGATKYNIAYRVANGCTSGCTYTPVYVGNVTSYTITGLTSSATVYAYVQACTGELCSGWSSAVTLQTTS